MIFKQIPEQTKWITKQGSTRGRDKKNVSAAVVGRCCCYYYLTNLFFLLPFFMWRRLFVFFRKCSWRLLCIVLEPKIEASVCAWRMEYASHSAATPNHQWHETWQQLTRGQCYFTHTIAVPRADLLFVLCLLALSISLASFAVYRFLSCSHFFWLFVLFR